MKFACCKSTIEGAAGTIQCSNCKNNYHAACMLLGDKKKPNQKSFDLKKDWVCPECLNSRPRQTINDNTPVRVAISSGTMDKVTTKRGASSATSPPECHNIMTSDLYDQICSIVSAESDKLYSKIKLTITEVISTEIQPLKAEVAAFKESLTFLNQQYDTLNKRIDNIEADLKTMDASRTEVGNMKSCLDKLDADINNKEQWSRRSNIEIYGIPEKKGENLIKILETIAGKIDFPLNTATDLDFITRVAPKSDNKGKIKPVVLRFLARYKKDDFLASAKKLKLCANDIGFPNNMSKIYFNEHLTRMNKQLLQLAKVKAKELNFKYVWVKNCSIFMRRSDNSPVVHIEKPVDLNKLK